MKFVFIYTNTLSWTKFTSIILPSPTRGNAWRSRCWISVVGCCLGTSRWLVRLSHVRIVWTQDHIYLCGCQNDAPIYIWRKIGRTRVLHRLQTLGECEMQPTDHMEQSEVGHCRHIRNKIRTRIIWLVRSENIRPCWEFSHLCYSSCFPKRLGSVQGTWAILQP